MTNEEIGQFLKDARKAKGLTQRELGEILGVNDSAIAKYEKGRVVNLKRSVLKKMADTLGFRPSDLFADDKEVAHIAIEKTPPETQLLIDYVRTLSPTQCKNLYNTIRALIGDDGAQ